MKLRTKIFISLSLAMTALPATASDLSIPYAPTRAEWLQLALNTQITQVTDLWQRRVGVVVGVFPKDKYVAIVISSSNGQAEPSEQEKATYVRQIASIANITTSSFEWAKDIRISVKFQ